MFAQEHTLVVVHESMAHVGKGTASYANGVDLGHLVGDGAEGWDWTEGHALVIHVEACHDDTNATVG